MVSTPHGDAHEEVAANYAAALSRFGLKVALIATSPDQAWYADRFQPSSAPAVGSAGGTDVAPAHHGSTFPELLAAAHAGTLNGQLRDGLSTDERAPNLVVVPPSDEAPVQLPVDGLPPLLLALSDAGIDIVVVSGPALLEDADATIVAWATRCVLWAIVRRRDHLDRSPGRGGAPRARGRRSLRRRDGRQSPERDLMRCGRHHVRDAAPTPRAHEPRAS